MRAILLCMFTCCITECLGGIDLMPGPVICLTDDRNFVYSALVQINNYCDQLVGAPIILNTRSWRFMDPNFEEQASDNFQHKISMTMKFLSNPAFTRVDKVIGINPINMGTNSPKDDGHFIQSNVQKILVQEIHHNNIDGVVLYLSNNLKERRVEELINFFISLKQAKTIKYIMLRLAPQDPINDNIVKKFDPYISGYLQYKTLSAVYNEKIRDDPLFVTDKHSFEEKTPWFKTFAFIIPRLQQTNLLTGSSEFLERDELCKFLRDDTMEWRMSVSFNDAFIGRNSTNFIQLDTLRSVETLLKFMKSHYFGGFVLKVDDLDFVTTKTCPLHYEDLLEIAFRTWHGFDVAEHFKTEEKDLETLFKKFRQTTPRITPPDVDKKERVIPRNNKVVIPIPKAPEYKAKQPELFTSELFINIKKKNNLIDEKTYKYYVNGNEKYFPSHKKPQSSSEDPVTERRESFIIRNGMVYKPPKIVRNPEWKPLLEIKGKEAYLLPTDYKNYETMVNRRSSGDPELIFMGTNVYLAPRWKRKSKLFEDPDDPENVMDGLAPKYVVKDGKLYKIIYNKDYVPKKPEDGGIFENIHFEPIYFVNEGSVFKIPERHDKKEGIDMDEVNFDQDIHVVKKGIVYKLEKEGERKTQDNHIISYNLDVKNLKPQFLFRRNKIFTAPHAVKQREFVKGKSMAHYENPEDNNEYLIISGKIQPLSYFYDEKEGPEVVSFKTKAVQPNNQPRGSEETVDQLMARLTKFQEDLETKGIDATFE